MKMVLQLAAHLDPIFVSDGENLLLVSPEVNVLNATGITSFYTKGKQEVIMSTTIETQRIKEALALQISAIKAYAGRLSGNDIDQLESDFQELQSSVAELGGMLESLPHRHPEPEHDATTPASPASMDPKFEIKDAGVANPTQRPKEGKEF